jgi:hypothetical protein
MRDFIKSMIGFTWAMPLFAARQVTNLVKPGKKEEEAGDPVTAFNAVTQVAEEQFGDPIKSVFHSGDKLQREVVDLMFDTVPIVGEDAPPEQATKVAEEPSPDGAVATPQSVAESGRLDVSRFVVLGEGLAAGMGDFGLNQHFQKKSFPAQMAGQMGTDCHQPLMEPPGLGELPGFAPLPLRFPAILQYTALSEFPPTSPLNNLSIPNLKVADALTLRPCGPLTHRADTVQTAANLILGMPQLLEQDGLRQTLPTQLESAVQAQPTFALVALGYSDILEGATKGDLNLLPDISSLGESYKKIIGELTGSGAAVVVATVPDPVDTAYFSTIESAAKNLKVEPSMLLTTYGLKGDELISVSGLMDMGYQFLSRHIGKLEPNAVVSATTAAKIASHVQALNAQLVDLAHQHEAVVYDLHAFFRQVHAEGVELKERTLSADFLGGFYTLNGYYPGHTGQALIANEVLELLNRTYGANFPLIDVDAVQTADPVASYQPAEGPNYTAEDLAKPYPATDPEVSEPPPPPEVNIDTAVTTGSVEGLKLQLPPGLEQVLPLNKEASYFGDAIRAAHCEFDKDKDWGASGDQYFGGLCLVDSHLSGYLHIKFSQPVDNITHFEVSHGHGLVGDDGTLSAPQFFKLPALHNSVKNDAEKISQGDLNLETGDVTNLEYVVRFMNTALMSLVRANPHFPDVPMTFPGMYGSAWAKFEQRPDGLLDFNFYGTTFIPLSMKEVLGPGVRFPLPFCSPTLQFASIPADGTSLHPHLHLSTKAPPPAEDPELVPEIPTNTIMEFTLYTHNTSFGDAFSLNLPELGGEGTGRSHLMGRFQVQFGERFGDSVSIATSCLTPGGLLAHPPSSPLIDEFPGRLSPGPIGHNEALRFPLRTYYLESVYYVDDPFELSLGAVSTKTGHSLGQHLHRGMIGQDMFFALMRVEPRTPKGSFEFRGPAMFQKDKQGRLRYRFAGELTIPYPAGFYFPGPDLSTKLQVGPGSVLDPFLWIHGVNEGEEAEFVLEGGEKQITSSKGDVFSYTFNIPNDPAKATAAFEYINHSQDGLFRMDNLSWVSFINSPSSKLKAGKYDTVTFTGWGTWSKGGVDTPRRVATVQVSTAKESPYVSIQIDGGFISNVNTKPVNIEDVHP